MPAPEKIVPNMLGYWRAANVADNKLTDLSGNGRDLKFAQLPLQTTRKENGWGVAGRAVMATSGFAAEFADAAEAAPWKPLHDGSGASWWTVLRATGTSTHTILDTGGMGPTIGFGMCMRVDGERERLGIEMCNGGGSGYLIDNVLGNWWTWNGTFKRGVPHVLVVTYNTADSPDIQMWLDGRLLGSLSIGDREKPTPETRPIGAGVPTKPLRLLGAVNGIWPFGGEMAELGIASGSLSAAQRRGIEDWAAEYYGVTLTREKQGILLWDGNSLVDNIWRPHQFPELVTPKLNGKPRSVMRAIAGLQVQQMIDRAPKHVIPVYDREAPYNIIAVTEVLNSLAEGVSRENTFSQLVAYCQARRAEGWKVVVAPPLPCGAGIKQADLDWVKDQIVANWKTFADAIVRADLDPVLGSWDVWAKDKEAKVYRNDTVHFTPRGNEMFAPYWVTAINEVLATIEKEKPAKP